MRHYFHRAACAVLCLAVLLCAGCGAPQTPSASQSSPSPTQDTAEAEAELRTYLRQTLIPKYGLLSATPIRRAGTRAKLTAEELSGMIGAQIADLDADGNPELLTFTAQSEQKGDVCTTTVFLDVYAYTPEQGVARADGRSWQSNSFSVSYQDMRSSLFTYTHNGTLYIGLHTYFNMNDSIDILWLYTYQNGSLSFVNGASLCIGGDEWFYLHQGQTDPADMLVSLTPSESWNGWSCTRQEHRGDDYSQANVDRYHAAEAEVQQQYTKLFADYGLTRSVTEIQAGAHSSDTKRTLLDTYQATEGSIQLVGALATPVGYDTEAYLLLQATDGTGELDAAR
ncbi:MAG: hypothetical protein ACLUFF_01025 [Acutalibacteraceae bacterium]